VFDFIPDGNTIGCAVTVEGFLVMRVGNVAPCRQAASGRRQVCQAYAVTAGVAQAGWVT
jgi:hypothetical protein